MNFAAYLGIYILGMEDELRPSYDSSWKV